MSFVTDWVKSRREKRKTQDVKSQNSTEENELLEEAKARFEIAYAGKTDHNGRHLHLAWREYDRIYRSNQWKESAPAGKSQPVLNFTLALIESVVPRITAQNPDVLVVPRRDPANKRLADQLKYVQQYLWYVNRMQAKMPGAVRMALKYGTTIFKTVWDPDFHDEYGDASYNVVHPMNFFPDPRAYEINQMDYCFTRVPKSTEYFMRRWPDKGSLVTPDQDWTETEQITGADGSSEEEVPTLTEYWFGDEEGHVCVMYYAGDVVLEVLGGKYDGTNKPVNPHNRWPFARFVDYEVDKHFWGMGEVEIAEMIQRLINSFEAQIIDNTRLMANSEWIVNMTESGLTEEDSWIFDNSPGNVIFTHRGGVDKVSGTPIPVHVPEHQDKLIFMLEQILGIHDVVQGRRPVGVRAASAIIALQEAANVRVEQKTWNLQEALREMADQANWLVLENYDEPRSMRLAGSAVPTTLNIKEVLDERMLAQAEETGLADDIVYDMAMEQMPQDLDVEQLPPGVLEGDEPPMGGMMPPDMGGVGGMAGMGIQPGTPVDQLPGPDQQEAMDRIYEELRFPDFDVEVKIGPSIPNSQALMYEQAKEFFQLGIIDRRAVLESTNFPGWEKIVARMEQMEAAMMQEQQDQHGEGERVGERTY